MNLKHSVITIAILAILVPLLALSSPSSSSLDNYLDPVQAEHMKILGYRNTEQFRALASSNADMLCEELGMSEGELNELLDEMPGYRTMGGEIDPDEQPIGVILEEEPEIIGYMQLLEEHPAISRSGGDSVDLTPYCTPIRDQIHRGTCVAFGSVAFREYELKNNENNEKDLSEQFYFWACKQRDGSPNSDGTYMTAGRDVMKYDGACLESTWPYNGEPTGDPAQGPPPAGAADEAKQYAYPDIKYYSYRGPSIDTLKDSFKDNHIVTFAVPVYKSWYESEETRRTGEVTMPLSGDSVVGGHCMALVGYQDDPDYAGGGYFILRNSWGEDWGYESPYGAGYGTIPYAYIDNYWNGGWIAA